MKKWQLQEAKARFSEVVRQAKTEGPQDITVHGKSTIVILSREDFNKLSKPKPSFVDFIRHSPLRGIKLIIKRNKSLTRDLDL